MSVNVEFVGHACFRIWVDGRPSIVTDPYPARPARSAAAGAAGRRHTFIVSSLTDEAHSHVDLVAGSPRVINALDVARGQEAAIGGEAIVHRGGDRGARPPARAAGQRAVRLQGRRPVADAHGRRGLRSSARRSWPPFAGKCDALFALAGQRLTPKFAELDRMFEVLAPRWVLPMHYELPPLGFGMTTVEEFLAHRSDDPLVRPRHHNHRAAAARPQGRPSDHRGAGALGLHPGLTPRRKPDARLRPSISVQHVRLPAPARLFQRRGGGSLVGGVRCGRPGRRPRIATAPGRCPSRRGALRTTWGSDC